VHGLPKDFDASVLVGGTLETVTFASNAIHLAFDNGNSVTAQMHLRYRGSPESTYRDDVLPVSDSSLMSLVGQRVVTATAHSRGDLTLELDAGGTLQVQDDSEHYESYTIKTPDREIFV
jgi:hypothetical protein